MLSPAIHQRSSAGRGLPKGQDEGTGSTQDLKTEGIGGSPNSHLRNRGASSALNRLPRASLDSTAISRYSPGSPGSSHINSSGSGLSSAADSKSQGSIGNIPDSKDGSPSSRQSRLWKYTISCKTSTCQVRCRCSTTAKVKCNQGYDTMGPEALASICRKDCLCTKLQSYETTRRFWKPLPRLSARSEDRGPQREQLLKIHTTSSRYKGSLLAPRASYPSFNGESSSNPDPPGNRSPRVWSDELSFNLDPPGPSNHNLPGDHGLPPERPLLRNFDLLPSLVHSPSSPSFPNHIDSPNPPKSPPRIFPHRRFSFPESDIQESPPRDSPSRQSLPQDFSARRPLAGQSFPVNNPGRFPSAQISPYQSSSSGSGADTLSNPSLDASNKDPSQRTSSPGSGADAPSRPTDYETDATNALQSSEVASTPNSHGNPSAALSSDWDSRELSGNVLNPSLSPASTTKDSASIDNNLQSHFRIMCTSPRCQDHCSCDARGGIQCERYQGWSTRWLMRMCTPTQICYCHEVRELRVAVLGSSGAQGGSGAVGGLSLASIRHKGGILVARTSSQGPGGESTSNQQRSGPSTQHSPGSQNPVPSRSLLRDFGLSPTRMPPSNSRDIPSGRLPPAHHFRANNPNPALSPQVLSHETMPSSAETPSDPFSSAIDSAEVHSLLDSHVSPSVAFGSEWAIRDSSLSVPYRSPSPASSTSTTARGVFRLKCRLSMCQDYCSCDSRGEIQCQAAIGWSPERVTGICTAGDVCLCEPFSGGRSGREGGTRPL